MFRLTAWVKVEPREGVVGLDSGNVELFARGEALATDEAVCAVGERTVRVGAWVEWTLDPTDGVSFPPLSSSSSVPRLCQSH